MKEVTCICGERLVFLDPEVEVKTCPNCGMPVRQYPLPTGEEAERFRRRPVRRVGSRKLMTASIAVALLLAGAAIVVVVATIRRGDIKQAGEAVAEARAAEERGALHGAADAYKRALSAYKLWNLGSEYTKPIEAAVARLEGAIADAAERQRTLAGSGLLGVSLEELAAQAYSSSPEMFGRAFAEEHAGRSAVMSGAVREAAGGAYKASALTVSYMVFSPSGRPVEVSFDGPFFERYRMKAGNECLVTAVLSRMYLDPGAPGRQGHWVLVLDSRKSALVTDAAQLEGVGWEADDQTRRVIEYQRSLSPAY